MKDDQFAKPDDITRSTIISKSKKEMAETESLADMRSSAQHYISADDITRQISLNRQIDTHQTQALKSNTSEYTKPLAPLASQRQGRKEVETRKIIAKEQKQAEPKNTKPKNIKPKNEEIYEEENPDEERLTQEELLELAEKNQKKEKIQYAIGMGISVAVHILLLWFAALYIFKYQQTKPAIVIETKIAQAITKDMRIPEVRTQKISNDSKSYENDEPISDDPAMKSGELSDHDETDNDEEFHQSKGTDTGMSDSPLQGDFKGNKIGIGGSAGGIYGGRMGGNKNLRAKTGSGGMSDAVEAGLLWLKRHQSANGNWSAKNYTQQCGADGVTDSCSSYHAPSSGFESYYFNTGDSDYDVSLTGLALLCFLCAGSNTSTGKYCEVVKKGVQYLLDSQEESGCFGHSYLEAYMYNHSVATWAIAEAYALDNANPFLMEPLQKAVDFLLKAQKNEGAWGYTAPCDVEDTSVTGWAMMALNAAQTAGLNIPERCYDGVKMFLERVNDNGEIGYYRDSNDNIIKETSQFSASPIGQYQCNNSDAIESLRSGTINQEMANFLQEHGISISPYLNGSGTRTITTTTIGSLRMDENNQTARWKFKDDAHDVSYDISLQGNTVYVSKVTNAFAAFKSMTALAITSRIFMNVDKEYIDLTRGADVILSQLPQWGEDENKNSLVCYYYWHWATLALYQMGNKYWDNWKESLFEILMNHQEKTGCKKGSWPPIGKQCPKGGRVYCTALNILSLEIYHRYGKIF
jgi:prenyltransferase beta subunit